MRIVVKVQMKDCPDSPPKNLDLEVAEANTVDSVKTKIQHQHGLSAEPATLYLEAEALEDSRTLSDCGVKDESVLVLVLGLSGPPEAAPEKPQVFEVMVKMLTSKSHVFLVEASSTVADLKKQVERWTGDPPEHQRLINSGKQLEDTVLMGDVAQRTDQNNLPTVYLVPKRVAEVTFRVNIRTLVNSGPNGAHFSLEVLEKDTVQVVKEKIMATNALLELDRMRLIFNGKALENELTLQECKITEDASLIMLHSTRPSPSTVSGPIALAGSAGNSEMAGACGLVNLGNTCFMNSILQALSNTVPLRQYYRNGDFKADVSDSPLGMKGRLANSFADLLTKIWEDRYSVLSPSELKALIAEKRPEFAGYQQHDAQEVLTFLLDGLHEDVNRAPYPRPIVEDPSTDGKEDFQVACEAWKGNLRRNKSRIVDMFQFQVRSEIAFPEADATSLKFDPMMYLSLPVPQPPHTIKITIMPRGYPQTPPAEAHVAMPKNSTFKDLQASLLKERESPHGRCFAFASMFNMSLQRFHRHGSSVGEVRHYDDVWAFEVDLEPGLPEEDAEFAFAKIRKRSSPSSATFADFAHPFVFAVRRRGIGTPGTSVAQVSEILHSQKIVFERYFDASLEASFSAVPSSALDEGKDLSELEELPIGDRFAINFKNIDSVLDAEPTLPVALQCSEPGQSSSSSAVGLQQCLEAFTRPEELAQEDWVRCDKTGGFERSLKKLDLWTAPDVLLVHLKRFGSDHLSGPLEKVETPVDAPVEFDLGPWLKGASAQREARYRLYAVVNHTGTMRFGHYTAHCRVGEGRDRRWYHFNDSNVTPAQEHEVVSKAAYILFYERESLAHNREDLRDPLDLAARSTDKSRASEQHVKSRLCEAVDDDAEVADALDQNRSQDAAGAH